MIDSFLHSLGTAETSRHTCTHTRARRSIQMRREENNKKKKKKTRFLLLLLLWISLVEKGRGLHKTRQGTGTLASASRRCFRLG